jgi:hypothetical protein
MHARMVALACAQRVTSLPALQDDSSDAPISLLGLGTWRLRGRMGVAFETLAAYLEGTWREMVTDLGLYPLPPVGTSHHFLCLGRLCFCLCSEREAELERMYANMMSISGGLCHALLQWWLSNCLELIRVLDHIMASFSY